MTEERKMAVNRRLRMFENPQMMDMSDAQGRPAYPDYTANLNALARLEAKLNRPYWDVRYSPINDFKVAVMTVADDTYLTEFKGLEPTEAQARAEAICQYLETQDAKSATAKL